MKDPDAKKPARSQTLQSPGSSFPTPTYDTNPPRNASPNPSTPSYNRRQESTMHVSTRSTHNYLAFLVSLYILVCFMIPLMGFLTAKHGVVGHLFFYSFVLPLPPLCVKAFTGQHAVRLLSLFCHMQISFAVSFLVSAGNGNGNGEAGWLFWNSRRISPA